MTDRFRLRLRPIEIETHPRFTTHYIQRLDIVDITTGLTVETVTAFDTDGCEAVKQAHQLASEAKRRLSQQEEDECRSGTSGQ